METIGFVCRLLLETQLHFISSRNESNATRLFVTGLRTAEPPSWSDPPADPSTYY